MKMGLVLVTLLVLSQDAAYAAHDSKAEQTLRKLDEQRIAALLQDDIPTLERIMADDFTYIHSSGQAQSKAELLADFKSGKRVFKSLKEADVQVRIYGSAAVFTGRCNLTGTNAGRDFELPMRFIEVYAKSNGHWQWVVWQSTRLAR